MDEAPVMPEQPRVIHDFYGFPDELFAFDHPAHGTWSTPDHFIPLLYAAALAAATNATLDVLVGGATYGSIAAIPATRWEPIVPT